MTRLYTKTGDQGHTGLFGGVRVAKDHLRVEAYGEVDELNSFLGLCLRATDGPADPIHTQLLALQRRLFEVGADLAAPRAQGEVKGSHQIPRIGEKEIAELEAWIDQAQDAVPPMRFFVLPGGSDLAARLHVARCVCRRAERRVVSLQHEETGVEPVLIFLNRLSDLLFALARLANHRSGEGDIPWQPVKGEPG